MPIRFLLFLPVAALLIAGYIVAGAMTVRIGRAKEGYATIRRWLNIWWRWVIGESNKNSN